MHKRLEAAENSSDSEVKLLNLQNQLQTKELQCEVFREQLETSDGTNGKDEVKVLRQQLMDAEQELNLKLASESTATSGKGDEIKRLQKQLSQSEKQLDIMEERLEAAENSEDSGAEMLSLKNQLQTKVEECQFLKEQLESADDTDDTDGMGEVKILRRQLLETKEQLNLTKMRMDSKSTVSGGNEDEMKHIQQQLKQKQKELNQSQRQLDMLHDRLEAHENQMSADSEAEVLSLKDQLQKKEEECRFLKEELEASR